MYVCVFTYGKALTTVMVHSKHTPAREHVTITRMSAMSIYGGKNKINKKRRTKRGHTCGRRGSDVCAAAWAVCLRAQGKYSWRVCTKKEEKKKTAQPRKETRMHKLLIK